jgi:hypothetical protein
MISKAYWRSECVNCGSSITWHNYTKVGWEHNETGSADCYADDWESRKARPGDEYFE